MSDKGDEGRLVDRRHGRGCLVSEQEEAREDSSEKKGRSSSSSGVKVGREKRAGSGEPLASQYCSSSGGIGREDESRKSIQKRGEGDKDLELLAGDSCGESGGPHPGTVPHAFLRGPSPEEGCKLTGGPRENPTTHRRGDQEGERYQGQREGVSCQEEQSWDRDQNRACEQVEHHQHQACKHVCRDEEKRKVCQKQSEGEQDYDGQKS